jgi:hypothetical protein
MVCPECGMPTGGSDAGVMGCMSCDPEAEVFENGIWKIGYEEYPSIATDNPDQREY